MKIALIDIDGVLANDTHRVKFALERRYSEYFHPDRMFNDSPFPQGARLVSWLLSNGWEIQYLTGRREDRRDVTREWLSTHRFPNGLLHMRTRMETMRLADFKLERMLEMVDSFGDSPVPNIVLWDDDPEVVKVVRNGLGEEYARHCTWHIKPEKMIRKATA